MASVAPFNGILYNPEVIPSMGDVVAPPYDVISPEAQKLLHERHPNNVIRLILGRDEAGDAPGNNRHTRAAGWFESWQEAGVLKQDDTPAFYLTRVTFTVDNATYTRYGLIATVKLEPFENGVILPHEQTFSTVKSERLELLKLCKANFSQIFSIYSDPELALFDTLLKAAESMAPIMDLVDDNGETHHLWRFTDTALLAEVTSAFADKCLYIADGHHRYETALNYRNWLAETDPSFDETHPANGIMMYLCAMEDPGMLIQPTHRVLQSLGAENIAAFRAALPTYFDVAAMAAGENCRDLTAEMAKQASDKGTVSLGVLLDGEADALLLTLRPGVMDELFADDLHPTLRYLDVSVLTWLLLNKLLGLTAKDLDNPDVITYTSNAGDAAEQVRSGAAVAAFILNGTRMQQVIDIAEAGEIMPRKTTYFYPKALTGLVLNRLTR